MAFCGGVLGAAIGGLLSFVLMGLLVLAGVLITIGGAGPEFLVNVAWGPVFGPHIGLLGGAIAAAYAYQRGYYVDGTQINIPLLKLRRLDVLLVGGIVGIIGYLAVIGLEAIPIFGNHLDAIAVAISLTMIAGRLAFGRSGLLGFRNQIPRAFSPKLAGKPAPGRKLWPSPPTFWLPYQRRWLDVLGQGLIVGALAAVITLQLLAYFPAAAGVVHEFAFAISAIALIGLMFRFTIPITHHITLPAATAVSLFLVPLSMRFGTYTTLIVATVLGAIVGAISGIICELSARLWLTNGDTLIDPPTLTNAILLSLLPLTAAVLR